MLTTPEQLRTQLRLNYPDTKFPVNDSSMLVMRFTTDEVSDIHPSLNSRMDGTNPVLDDYVDPFTGNGFLKSSDEIIPEYMPPKREGVAIKTGEIWEVLESGNERLVAVFDSGTESWIPAKG